MAEDKGRRLRQAAQGWLEIEIRGAETEALLNLAMQQGIELRQIRRAHAGKLRVRLQLQDVYALRPLLRACHCRFAIKRRAGWPFLLARGWRNFSLAAGGLLCAVALYLLCSLVWQVEVVSLYPFSAAERQMVLELAAEGGLRLRQPADKQQLAEASAYILAHAPELVFAQAERQGVRAYIHIVKRVDVAAADAPPPPGEIVARADGLIETILVRRGTAAVAPGATVKAGDVLVYAMGGGSLQAASALITARTWSEGLASWPLDEQGLRPSGAKSQGLLLRLGSAEKSPSLWLKGGPPAYEQFSHNSQAIIPVLWRNIVLPVELVLHTWYEQEPYATSYTREQALYHAGQRARALAAQAMPRGCELLSHSERELPPPDGQVRMQVIWEARGDIGEFLPLDALRKEQYQQLLTEQAAVTEPR